MPSAVKTTVTELPQSRVRVEVEVSPEEVSRATEAAAQRIGRDLKLAGFRKGKVPAPVVIGRMGREAVLDDAVRERMARWYSAAIGESRIVTVGDPDITFGELPAEREPFTFSFEIGVRPVATLAEWRGIEAPRRETAVADEQIDAQLEQARDRLARLEPVDRAAAVGDFVVIDFAATVDGEPVEGGEGRAQLVELGAGRLIPGFEDGIVGASAGEERTLELSFPDDYGAQEFAGRAALFAVSVTEVREKVLPALDDDFALDAAGFDTLAELRDDLRSRLLVLDERAVEREFRDAVLETAAAAATITLPDELIDARSREAFERGLHSLSHRGISKEAYLQISGSTEEELIAGARPNAERTLRAEAVIAAIVAAEAIEPSDEDLLAALEGSVEPDENGRVPEPKKLLAQLRRAGRLEDLRADVAAEQALERLVEAAVAITPERAAAREKLWTPGS
jgi:trigger factor